MITYNSIILFCFLNINLHPIHVSLSTIDFKNDSVNIVIKLDIESFKYSIVHNYLYLPHFENDSLKERDINIINNYIYNCFSIETDDFKIELDFNRYNVIDKDVILYYNGKINNSVHSVLVRNLLLFDTNINQTNAVIIKNGSFEEGYLLNKDKSKIKVSFKE